MVSVTVNLETVVQNYRSASEYLAERERKGKQRDETVPYYKHVITQFANNTYNFDAFRDALKRLTKDKFWHLQGSAFMMTIYELALYHLPSNPELEAHLRFIITGLNSQNVGQRIEQFYRLLTREKQRLEQAGISPRKIVSPGNSAFVISLLALWNDYENQPYTYYPPVRLGLATLINAKLIPAPSELKIDNHGVRIISEADHQAVVQTLNSLAIVAPQLKQDPYWAENFFIWLIARIKENPEYLETPIYLPEPDDGSEEGDGEPEELVEQTYVLIDDQPLMPTSEPLLTHLITELRKHILIEESVVRRIYQNLLNGHVIFTGPPGTGKTELAKLIPEILWQREELALEEKGNGAVQYTTHTAYTTTLVTATNEWSARTLISSIAPMINADKVSYRTQHGHLTAAILRNWAYTIHAPAQWEFHGRKRVQSHSIAAGSAEQEYQGHWLIIDEFNRAPIDTALGEALTALSDSEALLVPIDGTYIKVPLPRDFRIIGTLNSFDRNYLNKISEALKRRFSFIEIVPPTRAVRENEQGIVLYKALKKIAHLSPHISYPVYIIDEPETDDTTYDGIVEWASVVMVGSNAKGIYNVVWHEEPHPFQNLFRNILWPFFEVIRIYRQLGTAQVIKLVSQIITTGLLQNYTTEEEWLGALDMAFCDTIADQLQVLLPDELEVLSWMLKYDAATFSEKYNTFLSRLAGKQRRLSVHLEALGATIDLNGRPLLTDDEIEQLLEDEGLQLTPEVLAEAFHLEHAPYRLPQLNRRLRAFKAERSL